MVSDHLVEEIRARSDVVEILGEYVNLKRSGKSYRGPCPLHGGDGPNFAVDPDRQIFKCFVCGEGGDVFGFLMKHLGLDFPSAVRQVGARVGIEVPDRETTREDPHAHLRAALAFAAEWFRDRLAAPEGKAARAYLEGRGLGEDDIESFALGYAPDEWRAFRSAAVAHGLDESVLLDLGLIATSERAEDPYDRFRGRLMFAILDLRDRPIGFGGRILDPDSDAPKYLNSPESAIFHKGEELYGLGWARHQIRRERTAAIVEGFMDVIALHRADMRFAVAGLGTAFTRQQAQRLKRYADRAYLLYDSDRAGLKATFRTGDVLLSEGVHPLVVTLPAGEDPDSLIRSKGREALAALLADHVDLLERKLQILRREGFLDGVEGRRRAVDGVLSTLRAVADPALRDLYIDTAAESIGVRRDTLVHEIARSSRAPAPRDPRAATARREEAADLTPPSRAERELSLLLVRDPSLAAGAADRGLAPDQFRDERARAIFALADRYRDHPEEIDWSELPTRPRAFVERLLDDTSDLGDPGQVFDAAVRRLVFSAHRARLREIDRELELADSDQQRRLLEEKQRLAAELRAAGEAAAFMPSAHARVSRAERE